MTPKKSRITCVKESASANGRRNLAVYSFHKNKQSDYLSHVYILDKDNTGTEFIFDKNGVTIAQLPIYQGRLNGEGYFFDSPKSNREIWYFFHGLIFSKASNDQLKNLKKKNLGEIIPEMLENQAHLIGCSKEDLLKKRPPKYIFNRKEKEMNFIFRPVAQNTIVRPLAQAVCMMHGGEDTTYVDPTNKEEKKITFNTLNFIFGLETITNGRRVPVNGDLVAFQARHCPEKVRMKVEINDVFVNITPSTTVAEALAQFHRKLNQKSKANACLFNWQRD